MLSRHQLSRQHLLRGQRRRTVLFNAAHTAEEASSLHRSDTRTRTLSGRLKEIKSRRTLLNACASPNYLQAIAAGEPDTTLWTTDPTCTIPRRDGEEDNRLAGPVTTRACAAYEDVPDLFHDAQTTGNPQCYLDIHVANSWAGRIIVELRADVVPRTAENFCALCTCKKGFGYKGSQIHRVVPGLMLHAGDFKNLDGSGG